MQKSSSAKGLSNTSFVTRANLESDADHWVPSTDVICTDDGIVIKVELAGIRKEDLELTMEANRMTVSGQRQDEMRSTSKCSFQVMEINYGTFETTVDVPDGYELSQARAAYHNGFLRVDIPRSSAGPFDEVQVS